MLRYEHIEYLNFLFGIPVLILTMLLYNRWKKKALTLFGESKLVKELMHSFSKRRTQIKNMLTLLIFIALIIGIANPQVGTKMEEVKREGVDLMIAIDLSNSMMAEDIKPNRLERAIELD
jgi:Ca-activated chloride channel family protein